MRISRIVLQTSKAVARKRHTTAVTDKLCCHWCDGPTYCTNDVGNFCYKKTVDAQAVCCHDPTAATKAPIDWTPF